LLTTTSVIKLITRPAYSPKVSIRASSGISNFSSSSLPKVDAPEAIEATVSFIDPAAASPSMRMKKPVNYRVVIA